MRLRTARVPLLLSATAVAVLGQAGIADESVVSSQVSHDLGPVDLQVNDSDRVSHLRAMSLPAMAPGDSTAGVLRVENVGSVPLSYHVDAVATNPDGEGLGAALVVKVTSDASVVGGDRLTVCPGTPLPHTADRFTTSLVGTPHRQLAPGASESLCIQARLPWSAPATLQGATTEVSFSVVGTS